MPGLFTRGRKKAKQVANTLRPGTFAASAKEKKSEYKELEYKDLGGSKKKEDGSITTLYRNALITRNNAHVILYQRQAEFLLALAKDSAEGKVDMTLVTPAQKALEEADAAYVAAQDAVEGALPALTEYKNKLKSEDINIKRSVDDLINYQEPALEKLIEMFEQQSSRSNLLNPEIAMGLEGLQQFRAEKAGLLTPTKQPMIFLVATAVLLAKGWAATAAFFGAKTHAASVRLLSNPDADMDEQFRVLASSKVPQRLRVLMPKKKRAEAVKLAAEAAEAAGLPSEGKEKASDRRSSSFSEASSSDSLQKDFPSKTESTEPEVLAGPRPYPALPLSTLVRHLSHEGTKSKPRLALGPKGKFMEIAETPSDTQKAAKAGKQLVADLKVVVSKMPTEQPTAIGLLEYLHGISTQLTKIENSRNNPYSEGQLSMMRNSVDDAIYYLVTNGVAAHVRKGGQTLDAVSLEFYEAAIPASGRFRSSPSLVDELVGSIHDKNAEMRSALQAHVKSELLIMDRVVAASEMAPEPVRDSLGKAQRGGLAKVSAPVQHGQESKRAGVVTPDAAATSGAKKGKSKDSNYSPASSSEFAVNQASVEVKAEPASPSPGRMASFWSKLRGVEDQAKHDAALRASQDSFGQASDELSDAKKKTGELQQTNAAARATTRKIGGGRAAPKFSRSA